MESKINPDEWYMVEDMGDGEWSLIAKSVTPPVLDHHPHPIRIFRGFELLRMGIESF